MNGREEDLPSQAKAIVFELKKIAEIDPMSGSFVLVGQNGFLERYADSHRDSFVGSGLIEPNKVSLVLKTTGFPTNIFHDIGHPELWEGPEGKPTYEVENRFNTTGCEIEAFVIEREDPTGFITFAPRQDFVIFYSLFDRTEGPNRLWDDHMRGVSDVIKFERNEMLSKIRIMKRYILDYLFVRKKTLIIGYYFGVVVPAQDDIPDNFRKKIEFDSDKGKASILIAKDNISGQKLIAHLDMFKVIPPPNQKILADFGTLADAPKVTLKTSSGPVEMKKTIGIGYDVGDFLSVAYFSSEVLKKYEDDKRYRIDDTGGVHYAGVWGIFRGIWRLGDEVIRANVGDVAEGLPYEEWSHWASHNIDPLSIEEHRELQRTKPIQQLLNFLVSEVESFENRQLLFMTRRGVHVDEPLFKFRNSEQKEEIIRELKKTFTRRTTRNEFLNRTVELYKLLIDSLNGGLLASIVDSYDPNAKFDEQRQPKGSLKLLLTYLEFQTVERICRWSGVTEEEITSKVVEYYNSLQQSNFQAIDDFLLHEARQKVNTLREAFDVLFILYALRSKAGGAHLGKNREFKSAMRFLGFSENHDNFLQAYRVLILRLNQFFFEF